MYYVIGASVSSLHRESTDSLIYCIVSMQEWLNVVHIVSIQEWLILYCLVSMHKWLIIYHERMAHCVYIMVSMQEWLSFVLYS